MVGLRNPEPVLLDACCLINLYATGHIRQILRMLPMRFAVAQRVSVEAMFVAGGEGDDADEPESVDLSPLIAERLLTILDFENEVEEASFIAFAAELDDGEAMSCALALHRGYTVATDDRKTLRVLRADAPHVRVCTTPELLKAWSEIEQIAGPVLQRVLLDVRRRGRFQPRADDPLRAWWDAASGLSQ